MVIILELWEAGSLTHAFSSDMLGFLYLSEVFTKGKIFAVALTGAVAVSCSMAPMFHL